MNDSVKKALGLIVSDKLKLKQDYEPYETDYINAGYDRFKKMKTRDIEKMMNRANDLGLSNLDKEAFMEYLIESMNSQHQTEQHERLAARKEEAKREAALLAEKENEARLFIHIPKNAGMSIRRSPELKNLIIDAGPKQHKSAKYTQAVKRTMDGYNDHHGFEHARARDISPEVFKKRFAFAIVRNPWERVVSRYLFAKKVIENEKKVPASYADVSSFEAFLNERHKWGNKDYMWHRAVRGWYNQVDYVLDGPGRVDVLRFEHLDEDLKTLFGDKLPEGFTIKPRNVTGLHEGSYLDFYTPDTADIVERWYAKDIEHFGFDFDLPATQNFIGA